MKCSKPGRKPEIQFKKSGHDLWFSDIWKALHSKNQWLHTKNDGMNTFKIKMSLKCKKTDDVAQTTSKLKRQIFDDSSESEKSKSTYY